MLEINTCCPEYEEINNAVKFQTAKECAVPKQAIPKFPSLRLGIYMYLMLKYSLKKLPHFIMVCNNIICT